MPLHDDVDDGDYGVTMSERNERRGGGANNTPVRRHVHQVRK